MSKKILMMFATVLLVGITVPAFAAVENVKVGGDISIYGVYRKNFDFTKDTVAKDSTRWLMTTTRVYVSSKLTENVEAVIRLINERDWADNTGATNDQIELDLAYIKLSDIFVPGLSATLGRQEIILGEGFIIGDLDPDDSGLAAGDLSSALATDALRLDYEVATIPLTLTGFAAKINENFVTPTIGIGVDMSSLPPTITVGNDVYDQDLYGVNANYQVPIAEAEVEGYFVDLKNSNPTKNTTNVLAVPTFGLRAAHNIATIPGLSWKGEFAMQWGKNNVVPAAVGTNEDNKGYAGYGGIEYAFQDIAWEPTLGFVYYHFSGDDDATDSTNNAWNPLFPDAAGDRIGAIVDATGLVNNWGQQSNMQVIKLSGSIQPTEKISLDLTFFNDQLVKTAAGEKKELGNEIDLNLGYAYSEDVEFGLTFGYFARGSAIKNAVDDASGAGSSADAIQLLGSVAVAF
ncbi:MAG: alginate export family protein [Candidatus Omnitrophica bacterium]|nr:alginate export family protein [Candidatus Omnitrophota bacterium]